MSYGVAAFSDIPFSDEGSISVSVAVSGVSATGSIGTVQAGEFVTVVPTGVEATSAVGTPTFKLDFTFSVTGVVGTFQSIGPYSVNVQSNVTIFVTGNDIAATSALGSEEVLLAPNVYPTGETATGGVGTPLISTQAIVSVTNTNLLMTSTLDDVSVGTGVTVFPTGVSATGDIGFIQMNFGSDIFPTGLSMTGSIGDIAIWQEVDSSQTPNWVRIAA